MLSWLAQPKYEICQKLTGVQLVVPVIAPLTFVGKSSTVLRGVHTGSLVQLLRIELGESTQNVSVNAY